jgi:hypothetical protein
MMVFRSLTIGLLGACLYLLGNLQVLTDYAEVERPSPPVIKTEQLNHVTVIDVAPQLSPATIASLVRLDRDERIVAVGDRHVGSSLEAGMEVADVLRRGSNLLDLTVSGDGAGVRRVIVVRH